jgi:FAD synthetase
VSLEALVSKYIASAEQVFNEMQISETPVYLDVNNVKGIVDFAKAYLEDAKYYMDRKRFEVSLASVAYCEGLLDALKMLGAVKFEWSMKEKAKKGK